MKGRKLGAANGISADGVQTENDMKGAWPGALQWRVTPRKLLAGI